tara:strand:- start:188 stop:337 length:150 start_codon:yes stop_codon:yes gene_type:complete
MKETSVVIKSALKELEALRLKALKLQKLIDDAPIYCSKGVKYKLLKMRD